MNWTNVFLIFRREVRDQMRDRRMLFMMFVLPILLYPLMGFSFMQLSQFMREHPAKVLVLGAPSVKGYPRLIVEDPSTGTYHFAATWVENANQKKKPFQITAQDLPKPYDPDSLFASAKEKLRSGQYEVIVVFPPDFAEKLLALHGRVVSGQNKLDAANLKKVGLPAPLVFANGAKQTSQLAQSSVKEVLGNWRNGIIDQHINDTKFPKEAIEPFRLEAKDVAEIEQRSAAAWAKILPMMLILWALTGAFYPAIDLCAGEKERGTLETLLCSPAEREEIVTGKMLTVMLFSVGTSLLNILSVGTTGLFIVKQLKNAVPGMEFGSPPWWSCVAMVIVLIPISILFSALCVALASYARSNKEGQYYLMPLLMTVIPLVFIPIDPRVEMTLGTALIPITGLMLVIKTILEGEFMKTLPFLIPVALVTLTCCWIAVRWAVDQFNREEVLFRESERFDLRLWLKHLFSEKRDTPNVGMALACALLILLLKLGMEFKLAATPPMNFWQFFSQNATLQFAVIAAPVVFMAVMMTTRPLKTLLLNRFSFVAVFLAILLAVALHPTVALFGSWLKQLYPMSEETEGLLKKLNVLLTGAPIWALLLLIAVIPAICEELAFRGFILSGFRHWGSRTRAIVVTSIFFGALHGFLHQSINATLLGFVIGYIAVKTESLWPCIAFHITNNSLGILMGTLLEENSENTKWFIASADNTGYQFQPTIIVIGLLAAGVILAWFGRLPQHRTDEEELYETIQSNRTLEMT
jgi:sodium transport system permease protein